MKQRSFSVSVLVLSTLGWLAPPATIGAQGLPPVPAPLGNPVTAAKANLGKVLFWDEQLSSSRAVACGTCHVPTSGGSDPRSALGGVNAAHPGFDGALGTADDVVGSPGVIRTGADLAYDKDPTFDLRAQVTGRKAQSVINAAYSPLAFWDGRASAQFVDPVTGAIDLFAGAALESQAVAPPLDDVEMGHAGQGWGDVAARLAAAEPLGLSPSIPPALSAWIDGRDYPALFAEAFGSPAISATRIARAIATYERTLISDQAPVTQAGAPGPAGGLLPPLEEQGQALFVGKGRCVACHAGPLFTNQGFRYIGVRPIAEDLGRGAVTGDPADAGTMKVPSLLNVELRAPYFHTGTMPTLEDVVDFYDRGGDFDGPTKAPAIAPIGFTPQEKTALVAFLRALTDPRVAAGVAPFDRPLLFSESALGAASYGLGAPGSGGFTPRLFSVEPPKVGNPDFTVALERGLGGAPALVAWDFLPGLPGQEVLGVPLHLQGTPAAGLAPTTLADVGAGEGYASLSFQLPAAPPFAGIDVFAQGFVLDPGAPEGLAGTAGLRVTLY